MNAFALYLHLPFCVHKCPYCDFNSYGLEDYLKKNQLTSTSVEERYTAALISELSARAAEPDWEGREISTIFFGGGTPSLFSLDSLAQIIHAIHRHFKLCDDIEITLEANPGTIREELAQEKLFGLRKLGVNRISMGTQSFNNKKLAKLGRIHRVEDAVLAVANVRAAGFENFNLDLMYGIQGETIAELRVDLEEITKFSSQHISAYCLTIEPGTEFGRLAKKGHSITVDEELQAEMYDFVKDSLQARGYQQYEISNFAKPGEACRHNLAYWSGVDYLGLGAGAHSYRRAQVPSASFGYRWSNLPGPLEFMNRRERGLPTKQLEEEIDLPQAITEFFFLRLRKNCGVSRAEYQSELGLSFSPELEGSIEQLVKQGLLTDDGQRIALTARGFLFANTAFETISSAIVVENS